MAIVLIYYDKTLGLNVLAVLKSLFPAAK